MLFPSSPPVNSTSLKNVETKSTVRNLSYDHFYHNSVLRNPDGLRLAFKTAVSDENVQHRACAEMCRQILPGVPLGSLQKARSGLPGISGIQHWGAPSPRSSALCIRLPSHTGTERSMRTLMLSQGFYTSEHFRVSKLSKTGTYSKSKKEKKMQIQQCK